MSLQPQLVRIEAEFESALERLHRLAAVVPHERWAERPGAGRWSVAECVDHLNRTAESFVPALDAAILAHRSEATRVSRRYRRDPLGWLLSIVMPPPVRWMRAKTSGSFVPSATPPPAELVAGFEALQREQVRCLREADGLPLDRIMIASPFDARAKYNLYSCFVILPRHQHRHLWQAEQAWQQLSAAAR